MSKPSASWVIVEKATGNAIAETFLRHVAEAVNEGGMARLILTLDKR